MKTADFVTAVKSFGWELERSNKHAVFKQKLFPAQRPVTLSLNMLKNKIDPESVENTAKCMGLRWKDMDPQPFPRQGHPYFPEYQRLGLATP